jgi:hypothetical protein
MDDLPEIKITTSFLATDTCAVCGCEWEQGQTPVPTAYTVESIEAGDPPEVVCDICVEKRYPEEKFAELMAERKRFWRS